MALFALPEAVEASGDYGCYFSWKVASPSFECANRAALSPGNDSRVNLLLLMREGAGLAAPGIRNYAPADYSSSDFGRVFLNWPQLKSSYFASPEFEAHSAYNGSRCDTLPSGADAFRAAILTARKLKEADREALGDARARLSGGCGSNGGERMWPTGIGSKIGQDFLTYMVGADAFYAGRFDEARTAFTLLSRSRDPWVAETSAYMIARNELVAAQEPAIDKWGDYLGAGKTDKVAARRGQEALSAYLKAYPDGLYASSARGLQRRALWLMGDSEALGRIYVGLLADMDSADPDIPRLIEEIDNKLGFARAATGNLAEPLLLAAADLQRMRVGDEMYEGAVDPITAREISAQAPLFADAPDLYTFVQANHAYYVARDYRRVLELLPDDARRTSYTPLAFSRQVLRGLALEALGDRNSTGFWQELTGGPKELYQRPLVELALAMNWERRNALEKVFTKDSPVQESELRIILLQHAAGEALLREQAGRTDRPARERDVALFMLLYKQLGYGLYSAFLGDLKLVPKDASKDGWLGNWLDPESGRAPVGLFTAGNWSEEYPCPALPQTVAALSRNARDPGALLCLGEFYRLNGFDWFMNAEDRPEKDELGGAANEFGGEVATRLTLYQRVIADRSASPEDKAYALYRAVWCYGPSGNNSCGGKEVPVSQRKAWFQQLKRKYPASRWAKDLKYYW